MTAPPQQPPPGPTPQQIAAGGLLAFLLLIGAIVTGRSATTTGGSGSTSAATTAAATTARPPTTARPTSSGPPATAAPPAATTPPGPAGVTVRPSGADDTAALVAAVAASPSVTIDQPLRIDRTARVEGVADRTISFVGAGALVRSTSTNPTGDLVTFPVLQLVRSQRVTINNLQVRGPGGVCDVPRPGGGPAFRARYDARYEESAGLSIDGSTDVRVAGGSITNVRGDGVRIFFARTAGQPDVITERVQISGLTTRCVGRAAITNVRSSDVTVTGGSYSLSGFWTFNVEPLNAWEVRRYVIDRPTVGYSTSAWLLVGGPRFSCRAEVRVVKPSFGELVIPESVASCVRATVSVIR